MRNSSVRILFLIAGIVLLSFTRNTYPEGPECEAYLLWFRVLPTVTKTCSQIMLIDLIPIEDLDNNGLPNEVPAGLAASSPYGCVSWDATACSIGYSYNYFDYFSQVERVLMGDTYYFRPKAIEVNNFRCCLTRPYQ